MVSLPFRGLYLDGSASYDAGQRNPSYSCGGIPPSWDTEISSVVMDDEAEFSSWWGEDYSLAADGSIPAPLLATIIDRWGDAMADAIIDELEKQA